MPVPYEPVIRHAWGPGDVVCAPCHNQLPNTPCGDQGCACVCMDAQMLPPILAIPEHLDPVTVWNEPITAPEPLELWSTPSEQKSHDNSPAKSTIKDFIARYEVAWGVLTVALYAVAVLMLVFVFPDVSNTWLAVLILVSGLTASLSALASVLKTKE